MTSELDALKCSFNEFFKLTTLKDPIYDPREFALEARGLGCLWRGAETRHRDVRSFLFQRYDRIAGALERWRAGRSECPSAR